MKLFAFLAWFLLPKWSYHQPHLNLCLKEERIQKQHDTNHEHNHGYHHHHHDTEKDQIHINELSPLARLVMMDLYKYSIFYNIIYQGMKTKLDNAEDMLFVVEACETQTFRFYFVSNLVSLTILNILNINQEDIEEQYAKRNDVVNRIRYMYSTTVLYENKHLGVCDGKHMDCLLDLPIVNYSTLPIVNYYLIRRISRSMLIIVSTILLKGVHNAE